MKRYRYDKVYFYNITYRNNILDLLDYCFVYHVHKDVNNIEREASYISYQSGGCFTYAIPKTTTQNCGGEVYWKDYDAGIRACKKCGGEWGAGGGANPGTPCYRQITSTSYTYSINCGKTSNTVDEINIELLNELLTHH